MGTRPWLPSDLPSGQLGPWVSAKDLTAGAVVPTWPDKSSVKANLTNATSSQQPTCNATAFNGKPGVVFAGSQGLFNSALPSTLFPANTLIGCFSAFQFGSTTKSAERIVSLANGSQNDYEGQGYIPILRQGSNATVASNRANSYYADTVALANSTPVILGAYYPSSTTHQISKNGTAGTAISTSTSTDNLLKLGVGCQGNGANIGANSTFGTIAEVVMTKGQLADADRQRLEGYLAWQWGLQANLPSGHPYANAAPTVTTADPVTTRRRIVRVVI